MPVFGIALFRPQKKMLRSECLTDALSRAGVLVLGTRVPFFGYSYSNPSVLGKYSYS